MTTDELRDRLAVLCGWTNAIPTDRFAPQLWAKGGFSTNYHPFPPNDYNALFAAWPGGWGITLNKNYANGTEGQWYAVGLCIWGPRPLHREELTAPTRYEAELRLTVAVLEAILP